MGVEQTDFRYKNLVLGSGSVREERGAHGMARRVLRQTQGRLDTRGELPAEFDNLPEVQRVSDVYGERESSWHGLLV
jgi:hypothetical protein